MCRLQNLPQPPASPCVDDWWPRCAVFPHSHGLHVKTSDLAALFGLPGISRCGCPLVVAVFPTPKCNVFFVFVLVFNFTSVPPPGTPDSWPVHLLFPRLQLPVQTPTEREPLTSSYIFLLRCLSPEALPTAEDIYHFFLAFCFPD